MTEEILGFKEDYEKWGSRYVIEEGEYKGHILEFKVICERIYPLNERDDVGLPRFRVSHHVVIRVLPPKEGEG